MKGTPSRPVISFRRPAISSVSEAPSMTQGPAMRKRGRPFPTWCPVSCMEPSMPAGGGVRSALEAPSGAGRLGQERRAQRACRANEAGEQRMAVARGGGELRVELGRQEPRMVRQLDELHQAVAREAREAQARLAVALEVVVVELETVSVPLHDRIAPVDLARAGAGREQHLLGSEAHGGALVRALVAGLRAAHLIIPLRD